MIKFFRRIRQQLLSENKFNKYLLYAIGEIVLVVIGILIALSINNWNDSRKEKLRSEEYHQRNYDDISSIINVSERQLNYGNRILKAIDSTIRILESYSDQSTIDRETIDYALTWISRTSNQIPRLSTFEEMMSNGELSLIYDVELRTQMAEFNSRLKLAETALLRLGDAIERDYNVFNRHIRSYTDPQTLNISHKYDVQDMSGDKLFLNTLSRTSYHWRSFVFFTRVIHEDSEELILKFEEQ